MTKERASVFGQAPADVDASEFTPKPIKRPDQGTIDKAAAASGFTRREPVLQPGDTQRRYRTGRTAQLNLKVTPELKQRFGQMADEAGVSQNELFERAVDALDGSADS